LDHNIISKLLGREEIKYLSEMMNYPGVINGNDEVIKSWNLRKKWENQLMDMPRGYQA